MRAAICAIVKNEGPYLREWVAYHRIIGFDDILVYDHNSTDESGEVLAALEREGMVQSIPWSVPPKRKPQWLAYEDGLERLRDVADWIAFIDLDEFIVMPGHDDIQEFLAEYGSLDAIAMNWKLFGTSGREVREPGLVIERFTRCAMPDFYGNLAVKTLARPEAILVPRVHTCKFREGVRYQTVTGEDATRGVTTEVSHDVIRVNHYFTRSRAEWRRKVAKGRGAKPPGHPKKHRTEDDFIRSNRNEDRETDILRYVPQVKVMLESQRLSEARESTSVDLAAGEGLGREELPVVDRPGT
jgi:glycosyltransferase involved in cell wall biosynthesis